MRTVIAVIAGTAAGFALGLEDFVAFGGLTWVLLRPLAKTE